MANVLIVEDEPVLRLTFEQFLREDDHSVSAARDFGEAVDLLRREDFDVVVTDIILPGQSGMELLRVIRETNEDIMAVVITGQPDVESAAEAVRLGAFDYIPKPVTGPALKRVVRLALDRKRLKEERDRYAKRMDRYRRDLEAVFNSVDEGILTLDALGRIERANIQAARILGLSVDELTRRTVDALALAQAPEALEALRETLAEGRPVGDVRAEITVPGEGDKVLIISTAPFEEDDHGKARAVMTLRDVTRLTRLEEQVENQPQFGAIIGSSSRMRELYRLIEDLAETDSTALIHGESGTGKELVATALHKASLRRDKPFIRVNCAALSEGILESELFGHVKGAFTGAVKDRVGRFEAADGGTILLDEIGDVSPRLQLRLLRVLQEREFERVGDSAPRKTNVRVIASTNQNLEERIRRGEFRQDLYYRLNVVRIHIPPLRQRREDIPLLVDHFVRRFNTSLKREVEGVDPGALDAMMRYTWPGNVRELENCLERAMIVCHEPRLRVDHLPPEILAESAHRLDAAGESGPDGDDAHALSRERIVQVLDQTDWNVAKSARRLGVARNTLYQHMKQLDIQRPEA